MTLQKILLINAEKCSGCDLCTLNCSFVKGSMFNPFNGRIWVIRCPEKGINIPMVCEHCINPPCEKACPTGAIKRGSDGIVRLNEEKCSACKLCVLTCPFGALTVDLNKGVAIKCDQCEGEPICAMVCPTGAITYVDRTKKNLQKKIEFMEKNYEIRRKLPIFYQIMGGGGV